jgi:hypothetical protein
MKGNMRQVRFGAVWMGVLAVALMTAAAASASPLRSNTGSILSLTAQGASQPGDPIEITSEVQIADSVNKSNLYYELFDPSRVRIDVWQTDVPKMKAGDTFSDAWQYANPPSTGDYTVTLCWSTGQSQNCDIDLKSTTFSSVPTLGWPLEIAALGLLGVWLWRHKEGWGR